MNLQKMLYFCQFSDSALPIGSFAFSNGLESAIQLNLVYDEATLKEFILVALKQSAFLDGIYMQDAYKLAEKASIDELLALDFHFAAKRVGKEHQLMSTRIGKKFATLFLQISHSETLSKFLAIAKEQNAPTSHAIVHGIIFNALALSQSDAFASYQYGTASMILSAAVRLMRIDHYQTQRILFELSPCIDSYYQQTEHCGIKDCRSFAPVWDCLISQHVSAHVRMFMN